MRTSTHSVSRSSQSTRLRAERLAQDLADPHAVGGVEAVAREEDQARDEALVAVAAQEQPHALALAEVEDAARDLVELVRAHLEQLVAREGVDDLGERLVVVAAGRERRRARAPPRPCGAASGCRGGTLAVGERRVEAEEAALADDVAVGVEALDADVVEVARPVHGRARVGLGQDQQVRLAARTRARAGGSLANAVETCAGAAAQQAEPGALDRARSVPRRRARTRGSRGT